MSTENEAFAVLLARVRARDPDATTQFVREYEPQLLRKVRRWLRERYPDLCGGLGPSEVCNSVLASFLHRVARGQYRLERPEDVWNLLVVMSRRRLRQHGRDQRAARRDARRHEAAGLGALEALSQEASPSREASARDELRAVRARLTAEEWAVAELRSQGGSWDEVAAALGGTAAARRMQLKRARDRIARELGLEEEAADG
jgi:RNA polymerase sigma-70 factor (ECF subfamily)